MKNRWVKLTNTQSEFFILDKIIKDGNTMYIGHYDGSRFIHTISPVLVIEFGTKTRFAQ
jgi:hypothetical protein